MRIADVQFLVAFDRWATDRILGAIERDGGIAAAAWSAPNLVDERGLGAILIHHLGATQRWRVGLADLGDDPPRPERLALPDPAWLRAAWDREWSAWESWLATLDDAWLEREGDGVPFWQMLAHVVNHGTQHRSEAAALLTDVGRSPGDLDMIDFAEAQAKAAETRDASEAP
jgi:uncharacterized damage-inducible protein DinB